MFSSGEGLLPLPWAERPACLLQVDLEEGAHRCEDRRCVQPKSVIQGTFLTYDAAGDLIISALCRGHQEQVSLQAGGLLANLEECRYEYAAVTAHHYIRLYGSHRESPYL